MHEATYAAADLVEGLVREYLTRSCLTDTLKAFDREQPRSTTSISSRTTLRKALGLERLPAKLSKPQATPTLDLWVQYQQHKVAASTDHTSATDLAASGQAAATKQSGVTGNKPLRTQAHTGYSSGAANGSVSTQPASDSAVQGKHTAGRHGDASQPVLGACAKSVCVDFDQPAAPTAFQGDKLQRGQAYVQDDLALEDVEDHSSSFGAHNMAREAIAPASQPTPQLRHFAPVSHTMMAELRQLTFGKEGNSQLPWPAWQQGFYFAERPGLQWGLVQRAGGPCGLLAAMQGHVIAAMWASCGPTLPTQLTGQQQNEALQQALAASIWQASDGATATVICSTHSQTAGLSFDQLCRSAVQSSCHSTAEVHDTVAQCLAQYQEPNGYGVVLLLMSVLATHTVRQTRLDMDESSSCLIAAHGYCSQDLVNLLLTGHAVTNCFDGAQAVAGQTCRGIKQPSQLGFLSLFEWFGYLQVGSHLKSPGRPIWVVCSESHFTVLFASNAQQIAHRTSGQQVSLLYYDGLANQDQPIQLTLSQQPTLASHKQPHASALSNGDDRQLVPPLEHVIHTKWPDVLVDWNGSDPIL